MGAEGCRAAVAGLVGGGGTNSTAFPLQCWSWLSCENLPGTGKFPSRGVSQHGHLVTRAVMSGQPEERRVLSLGLEGDLRLTVQNV